MTAHSNRPFVSVITPTYNRHAFLDNLITMYLYQTYPKERIEYIILDDSPEPFDISKYQSIPNLRYVYHPEKCSIPVKRNMLNKLAKGDIIVCFDDDDYYPPTRVSHAVTKLMNSKALIAGSTEMYIYDTTTKETYRMGPYAPNHGTNGTFAYKKEYLKENHYNEDTQKNTGEEQFFTKNFTNPMIQLNPWETILCFNHKKNTFDKTVIFTPEKKVSIQIKKVLRDRKVRDFFLSL